MQMDMKWFVRWNYQWMTWGRWRILPSCISWGRTQSTWRCSGTWSSSSCTCLPAPLADLWRCSRTGAVLSRKAFTTTTCKLLAKYIFTVYSNKPTLPSRWMPPEGSIQRSDHPYSCVHNCYKLVQCDIVTISFRSSFRINTTRKITRI